MTDREYLFWAIELGKKGLGHTRPNPSVGAVVVKRGKVVGKGYHHRCGEAHAEVEALRDAGNLAWGATLYVSLEPCSRPGRVGACTDAIIAAGIQRVVYAVADPNPKNHGRAKRILAKAGIACEHFRCTDILKEDAEDLIRDFKKYITTGLPFVMVKLAMSMDGRICDIHGASQWISSQDSRHITDLLRGRFDAIMVGAETVRKDNPSLLCHSKPNPDLVRVIVTRSGELPKNAQVFTDGQNETLVMTVGGTHSVAPTADPDSVHSYPTLESALRALAERGIMSVLCEGGLELARSLADAGLVDKWLNVMAPCVIGNRPIAEAQRFDGSDVFVSCSRVPQSPTPNPQPLIPNP